MVDRQDGGKKPKRQSFLTAEQVLADIEKDSLPSSGLMDDEESNNTETWEDGLPKEQDSSVTNCFELSAASQDAVELLQQIAFSLTYSPFDQEGELQDDSTALIAQIEKNVENLAHSANSDVSMPDVSSNLPAPSAIHSQELEENCTALHTTDRDVEERSYLRNLDVQSNVPQPSPVDDPDSSDSDGCDTNVQDKDYQPSSSSDSDTDTEELQTAEQDEGQETTITKSRKKRCKKVDAENWQKNVPKLKRLKGEAHISRRGKERGKVEKGKTGCTSKFCLNSNKRHCSKFTEEDRQNIFTNFWDLPSWSVRQSTVTTLTSVQEKKNS